MSGFRTPQHICWKYAKQYKIFFNLCTASTSSILYFLHWAIQLSYFGKSSPKKHENYQELYLCFMYIILSFPFWKILVLSFSYFGVTVPILWPQYSQIHNSTQFSIAKLQWVQDEVLRASVSFLHLFLPVVFTGSCVWTPPQSFIHKITISSIHWICSLTGGLL